MGARAAIRGMSFACIVAAAVVACTKASGVSVSDDAGAGTDARDGAASASDDGASDAPARSCTRVPESGACGRWPASADTFDDASSKGCRPNPTALACEVPNGSTVTEVDGGLVVYGPDGALVEPDCCDECDLTEYALSCVGDAELDPALGCHEPKYATPGAHPLCCPCSP